MFPQAIASWCRTQWVGARDVHVSFCGLIIRKREAEFRRACEQAIQDALDTLR